MDNFQVKCSIENFLKLPIDGKSYMSLEPKYLNPFLRCLEIMGETCLIEMKTGVELSTYNEGCQDYKNDYMIYHVYRKLQIYSNFSSEPYKEIIGIGLIPNKIYNGCGVLKLNK